MAIMCFIKERKGQGRPNFVSRGTCGGTRKCRTLRGKEALAGGDTSAERQGVSRKIARPLFFYVQDERYAAGAGMRTTAGMQEVE